MCLGCIHVLCIFIQGTWVGVLRGSWNPALIETEGHLYRISKYSLTKYFQYSWNTCVSLTDYTWHTTPTGSHDLGFWVNNFFLLLYDYIYCIYFFRHYVKFFHFSKYLWMDYILLHFILFKLPFYYLNVCTL